MDISGWDIASKKKPLSGFGVTLELILSLFHGINFSSIDLYGKIIIIYNKLHKLNFKLGSLHNSDFLIICYFHNKIFNERKLATHFLLFICSVSPCPRSICKHISSYLLKQSFHLLSFICFLLLPIVALFMGLARPIVLQCPSKTTQMWQPLQIKMT